MAGRWKPSSWSHSSVESMVSQCAYQLALDRLVGLPSWDHPRAAIGTAYHAVIEEHERARVAGMLFGTPMEYMEGAAMAALDECDVRWTAELDRDESQACVRAAIRHWWDGLRDRILEWAPISIEQRFDLRLPDVSMRRLSGIPDVIYRDSGGDVVVVDHKAAKDMARYPRDGSSVRPQAATYSRAVCESMALPPIVQRHLPRVEFHIARSREGKRANFERSRIVSVQPNEQDVAMVDARIRESDRQAAEGNWAKNPSWILCKPEWCPHHVEAGGSCDPQAPPEYDLSGFAQPLPVTEDTPGAVTLRT